MATIRRVNDKWQAVVRRQGHKTIAKTFLIKSTAEKWARQQETKLETIGVVTDLSSIKGQTVADLLTRYEAEIIPDKRSGDSERYMINSLRRAGFIDRPLISIRTEDIRQYAKKRLQEVSSGTLKRQLNVLQHAFNVAIRQWDYPLASNPVATYVKPKSAQGRTRRLQEGELDHLLKTISPKTSSMVSIIIQFAVETGMRRGEILSLRWENVDRSANTAYLPMTKNGSSRTVPLSRKTVHLLDSLDQKASGSVFGLSPNAFKLAWQRLVSRSGIADLHFHDLRHEAISRFFEIGLNIPEVALISGHKDHRMLMRYTHLKAEDVALKLNNVSKLH